MFILNGNPVTTGKFPNGETWVDKKALYVLPKNSLAWHYESDADIMTLIQIKCYLDDYATETRLYISYMPFSRMDRSNPDYIMSLRYLCDMINNLNFTKVTVREAHSEATHLMLRRNFKDDWINDAVEYMWNVGVMDDYDTIMFPDKGARDRYSKMVDEEPVVYGVKERDFKTGEITSFSLSGETDNLGKVLIIDDLCSRGGTFVHSAKLLKEHGASDVSLLVCHCEPTVFTGELFDHIQNLYTSPEMLRNCTKHEQVIFINTEDY